MRRATMAGAPSKYSLSMDTGRSTLSEDPRKKQRNVRDKAHQNQCIATIMEFLSKRDYDRPISNATLANPSLKDFQAIFRFIHSFIDTTFECTRKFEEEVIIFLKGIKYPYASEINRSQLIAITPHTWPVLLSMLAWLTTLIETVEATTMQTEPALEEETKHLFFNYLYNEYSAYMEGRDDDETGEKSIEASLAEINKEKIKKIKEYQNYIDQIKREVQQLSESEKEAEDLEEKRKQTRTDMDKLAGLKHHNEIRHQKYSESLAEAQNILNRTLDELADMYQTKARLEEEIKLQPIKPEDIAEMTEERDSLIKAMEEAKKAKTILIREIEHLNQSIRSSVEEAEKLIFDLSNIPSSLEIHLRIHKTKVQTDLLEYDEYAIEGNIEEEHLKVREYLQSFTKAVAEVESQLATEKERAQVLQERDKAWQEEISQKKERVKVHAQVYIEKKEASEEEYRRAVGRVDKAETELLKIMADGDNGLFQSEQNLERLKIKKGRALSKIAAEEAELQRITALISANIYSLKERVKEAYASLS
ncbi:kinetochore protein NDC80 [Nematocida homosporus]|uniref:kinetochore protein NDC80 n=1 Tax=Nematocida homosporus TaxID=1912981 RepID=UPI00222045B7|nr:kinetochore protein NDC80 [Nematocida homosporus]KAI5186385.1 kinetochore protein NDC80 [Nematocida homosporus]